MEYPPPNFGPPIRLGCPRRQENIREGKLNGITILMRRRKVAAACSNRRSSNRSLRVELHACHGLLVSVSPPAKGHLTCYLDRTYHPQSTVSFKDVVLVLDIDSRQMSRSG